MLFQNGALFDSLKVWENVAFGLLARGQVTRAQAREKAAGVLAQVGAGRERGRPRPFRAFRRHAEARGPCPRHRRPKQKILFFDEPTTGLDPIMGAVIDGLIVDCVRRLGSTAIAITHDMASAKRIGDRAAMLRSGRLICARSGGSPYGVGKRRGGPVHPWAEAKGRSRWSCASSRIRRRPNRQKGGRDACNDDRGWPVLARGGRRIGAACAAPGAGRRPAGAGQRRGSGSWACSARPACTSPAMSLACAGS